MSPRHRGELLAILARESYVEQTVTLASGRSSTYYVDCKRTLYLPRGAYLAGELMLELVVAEGVAQVGGMAAGALPLTDGIIAAAHRHGLDELTGFFVPKEAKTHGLTRRIEGAFRPAAKTALVDDTITTGGSTLEALSAVREAGGAPVAVFALVDRCEGAAEAFAAAGLNYRFIYTADEIRVARGEALARGRP